MEILRTSTVVVQFTPLPCSACFAFWHGLIICHVWAVFPIELVWLAGVFVAIGGSSFIILALNMTIVSDLSTEDNRSQMLFKAFAVKFVADLIAPQLAALTLKRSLWLPFLVAGILLILSFPVLLLLPETLDTSDVSKRFEAGGSTMMIFGFSSYKPLLTDWKILMIMVMVFLSQFRYIWQLVLMSYISVRFEWTISQVETLDSISPAVSLAVLVLLPSITQFLNIRWALPMARINLMILRASLIFLVLGSAMTVAAQSIPALIGASCVFSIGFGVRAPLLAVASTYISSSFDTGKLYTMLSITDAFTHIPGEPFIQAVWAAAIHTGGSRLVLPFLVILVLFIIDTALSYLLPEMSKDSVTVTDIPPGETDRLLSPSLHNGIEDHRLPQPLRSH